MYQNSYLFSSNAPCIEEMYKQYSLSPNSVDPSWHEFFKSMRSEGDVSYYPSQIQRSNSKVQASIATSVLPELINAYRCYGHTMVNLDPLGFIKPIIHPVIVSYLGKVDPSVQPVVDSLHNAYAGRIGFEMEHIASIEEKNWLYNKIESSKIDLTSEEKIKLFETLNQVQAFENYLHTKFVGAKRFSIEGCDVAIAAMNEIVRCGAVGEIDEVIIGMAHRGRLSTLCNVLHKPYRDLFAGFMGHVVYSNNPSFVGDVKYHLGYDKDVDIDGEKISISLTPNPSHLESVNPVAMGRARAKDHHAMCVLVHGDAALSGQGIVMESLAISNLEAYNVDGVVHIVTNNQIGFTTQPHQSRATQYCTDIARGLNIPVIHVNANDVEAVIQATRIALSYKLTFKKDVFIDIVGYRKYGHNEGDEPMFTQPIMYNAVHSEKSVAEIYGEQLMSSGILSVEKISEIRSIQQKIFDDEYEKAKEMMSKDNEYLSEDPCKHLAFEKKIYRLYTDQSDDIGCTDLNGTDIATLQSIPTGVSKDVLKKLGLLLSSVPQSFNLNSKIARQFENKKHMFETGKGIDWATGESLAFATLLTEKYNIRFTGEDIERGTFSHRHAVLTDQKTGEKYAPLQHLENSGKFFIANSNLSEFGVLGYEYGYAMDRKDSLTIWEAQFGDFANGAQVIIDQYISSAESKWQTTNNLVVQLPHGYEGQGPEHSSARLERFLQLCAQNNMQVCNPTTPASVFHLLRRQMLQDSRKPLIFLTPKSLLRHKLAVSNLSDMYSGTAFKPLIADADVQNKPKRIIFCSGKVYYDLLEYKTENNIKNVSLVRIEQLYPFPMVDLKKIINDNKGAEIVWCQEEPRNMGAYFFVKPIFENIIQNGKLKYIGRQASASPSTGFAAVHSLEVEKFINNAMKI